MKDLHTTPDEHLEARITAWVLGQASPFEEAELEALCAADPELQLFLNRTKALHSLLLETPPSSSDQFWKLSPENREKLDPIIGSNHSTPSNSPSGIRRAAYRAAFGIAAVLTVTLFIKRIILAPLSSDKEASNIVTFESSTDKVRFSHQAQNEVFFDKTASDGPSKSIATSSPRKPSAPSASAPAPASERDTTLALLDSKFKDKPSENAPAVYDESAGEAPRLRIINEELDVTKAEQKPSALSDDRFAKAEAKKQEARQNAMARNVPQEEQKALADNGVVNDGGIGYGSGGGGQSDMSNTYPAIEALALTNKADSTNTPPASPATIPVPTGELAKSSANYGDGKDFGGGWGSAKGEASDALAANDNQNKGGFRYEPGASKKESASSQGALSAEGLAAMKEKRVDANASITQEPGSNFTGTFKSAENENFQGLRSGDNAVERKSIDGILSNPDRSIATEQGAGRGPTGGTLKNDLANTDKDSNYNNPAARRELEYRVDTHSDSFRPAQNNSVGNLLMETDKAWELSAPAVGEKNEDAFEGKLSYLSRSKNLSSSDLDLYGEQNDPSTAWNDISISGATFASPLNSKTEGENNTPAEFEGFVNYGSPIVNQPKQIDITTKDVEGAQVNDQSRFKNWLLADNDARDELDLYGPADSAQAIEFQSLATGFTRNVEIPLLGDIPITGRLFQEGEKGKTLGEAHAGYNSEYLYRGLVVGDQKKPSLIDLSNELSAAEEAFSTFSLNISDASFQLALAAIEKGERPDPTSIKPEQFYNAVDYGDPAPSASEPVAAAIDQTAHPVIPGRNLVRVALRTGSTGRSAAQPLRLTLLVDQSGSMVRADRRVAMETALAQLATLLTEHDQVTVIGFSRTPHLLAQSLPGNQAAKLPELINQTASEGGTNLEQAINLATEQALGNHLAGAQNRIVLFTDGAANLGDADPDRLSEKIKNIRQQGLAFDIAGIGTNDVNDRLLSDLARHGNGRYYLVGEKTAGNLAAQLAGAFRPAAENVKVQVKLNPQRVGNYKLIGFEKDRLKTEDFRNDAVDAAELAADEAGVALYQVETLTEGTGEIGEVSVRFRDTATGEMVERTWTIPYDASAPSFDKANPKTQLATLALLAAQKLQTGPMADAIDFSNYSETIAKLKQANAKSAKTQQLLNLINAIK